VLSFADEAKVVKPKWLVEEMEETVSRMQEIYANQSK
jgi:predicted DNA-binding transcriptional regulator YafY